MYSIKFFKINFNIKNVGHFWRFFFKKKKKKEINIEIEIKIQG